MTLIGLGLCLIGIGLIGYDIIYLTRSAAIPRRMPKGKPPGTYEINMEDWDFPEG